MIEVPIDQQHKIAETSEADPKEGLAKELLARFNIPYRDGETVLENYYRGRVLEKLQEIGVIQVTEEGTVFDKDKLKISGEGQRRVDLGRNAQKRRLDILNYSQALNGVLAVDSENEEEQKIARPILVLPKSLKELQTGEYQTKAEAAIIQPWEIGQKFMSWTNAVKLAGGEETTFAELALAKTLQDFKARRNGKGELEIFDKQAGEYVKFSGQSVSRLAKTGFGTKENNIATNPLRFAKEQLPHLLEMGILQNRDFNTIAGSRTARSVGEHERWGLDGADPYIRTANSEGLSAQYYIGGKKLLGLNIKINPKTMFVKTLAPNLVGVMESAPDGLKIVATLDLATGEEMQKRRNAAGGILRKNGREVNASLISQKTIFTKDYASQHLKEYSITRFLSARSNESPEQYFERLRKLDEQGEILRQLKFFADLGVTVESLPWGEQLMLSQISYETKLPGQREQLKKFAQTYGVQGLRAFVSLDYDTSLGNKILEIGEKLDKKLAMTLFAKYGEIVDAANTAAQNIVGLIKRPGLKADMAGKVSEILLKKGKDLLKTYGEKIDGNQLEAVTALSQLEAIKTEVFLFAGIFKVLKEGGTEIDFADFSDTGMEILDSLKISGQDKEEMLRIFKENRPGYSPELLKETITEFKKSLTETGHEFTVLKHKGEIVAFIRFDQIAPGRLYAGSLNVRPEVRGSAIGSAMLTATLNEKNMDNAIEAVAFAKNPMLKHYLDDFGFEIIGELPNYHNTGELFYELARPLRSQAKPKRSFQAKAA